jgi:hypothetical protein
MFSEAYGEESVKNSSVFVWHKWVKEGCRKACMLKSQMKTLLVIFYDIKGTIHFEFIPQGQTVIQAYYVEILKQLHEAVCRKSPELRPKN